MAINPNKQQSSSSSGGGGGGAGSDGRYGHYNMDGPRMNVLASCYSVNGSSGALQGFHYSTTGAGGTSYDTLGVFVSLEVLT